MGSWNATCAISQLPIRYDNEVVFLTLVEDNSWGHRRNSTSVTSQYLVRSLPIYAKYNDYGGIEKCQEDVATKWFLKQFAYGLLPHKKHKKEEGPLTMDKALDWMHSGTAYIQNIYQDDDDKRDNAAIVSTMIRRDVWNFLLSFEWAHWRSNEKINLAAYKQHAENYYDWFVNKLAEYNTIADEEKRRRKLSCLAFEREDELYKNWFWCGFEYDSGYKLIDTLGYYRTMIDNQLMFPDSELTVEPLSREEAVAIYHKIAEVFFVEAVMQQLRKNWHLVSGNGSQDAEFEKAKAFHLKMAQIADDELSREE